MSSKTYKLTRNFLNQANAIECARWIAKHTRMTKSTVEALMVFRKLEQNIELEFTLLENEELTTDIPSGLSCAWVEKGKEHHSHADADDVADIIRMAKLGVAGDCDAAKRICQMVLNGELAHLYSPYC